MFFLYNILVPILSPIWAPWMLFRSWRRKEQPIWKERTGAYHFAQPDPARPRLWLHAVSVGEVIAALPILRELRKRGESVEIILSVTTSSGHQTAREQAKGLADHLIYFPLDVLRFQMSAMQQIQPKVVAIMETELWMNHLWSAKVFDAETFLVNGRISDRAFPRSSKIRPFYQTLFKSLDHALMQTPTDAERITSLGAKGVEVFGNSKFDQAAGVPSRTPDEWREELGVSADKKCVVVGSLRAEEFAAVSPAFTELAARGIQVVIAPRHLERTPELLQSLGASTSRRSEGGRMVNNLLVLDTYGELGEVYAVANLAIIGGGFADLGGQNLIQPMALGVPVVCGPHMQNFRDVAEAAVAAGAARKSSPATLADDVQSWLADGGQLAKSAAAARTIVATNVGASARYADVLMKALTSPAKNV